MPPRLQKSEIWQFRTQESASFCLAVFMGCDAPEPKCLPVGGLYLLLVSRTLRVGVSIFVSEGRELVLLATTNRLTMENVSVIAWGREEAYLPQHQTVLLFPLETSPLLSPD